MNGIRALITQDERVALFLLPCEDIDVTIHEEWAGPSNTKQAGTSILDFTASRTVRNRLLLFVNYPV
jgi:hypothetical protein